MVPSPTDSQDQSERKDQDGSAAVAANPNPGPGAAAETSKAKDVHGNLDGDDESPSASNKASKENNANTSNKNNSKPKPLKIKVHLVAVGSAPILKKTKFLMNADDRFVVANVFLRKMLKLTTGAAGGSSLFLYVNAAFVPSPEERMGDLFDCFGQRGELVVHYSLQEAWG